jgi:hypothetical protein
VIVGAPSFDDPDTDEGRAYLYLGSAAGLSTTAAWSLEGDQGGAQYGVSVASAGDVNGDGCADVIVGAEGYTAPLVGEGRAFVYLARRRGSRRSPHGSRKGIRAARSSGTRWRRRETWTATASRR